MSGNIWTIIVSSPWDQEGNDFCVISQAGGQLVRGARAGTHSGGEDEFRQSSRGELLYYDELLVFPQNASP